MTAQPDSHLDAPADPEHDPRASFALDPAMGRRLATRVASTTTETRTTYAPFTGQPLATMPVSSPDDVQQAADAARSAQRRWARVPVELRTRMLLDLHDLVLDRQD